MSTFSKDLRGVDLLAELCELREVIEHFPGFVGLQLPGNIVKWINGRGLALWNKKPEEIFGRSCLEVMNCVDEGCERCPVIQSFETGKGHTGLRKHESGRSFEVRAIPIKNSAGEVTAVLQLGRDVTQERALRDQLQQAQKLETVGRLASGIAHDFNNLLTAIFGNVSLARINRQRPEQLSQALDEIERATQGAADLVSRLLAFGRKEEHTPQVVDLNRLLDRSRRVLERVIGEDVAVVLECDSNITQIHADPTQLEQVLLNLAINARDAMPTGGTLTIATAQARTSPSESAPFLPGEHVLLTVVDTGRGMDDRTRQRIFEPFFTTKDAGKGTGLGLAMVYEIVQQHHGLIEVQSQVGEGTRFAIHLPAAPRDTAQPTAKRQTVPLPQGSEQIWVAEDEPMVRQLAAETLRSLGYRVHEAANGEEALALVRLFGDGPSLLITDVVMPKLNGRELAERLCRQYSGLKVLFTSGYAADLLGDEELSLAGRAFLAKPYTQAQLARKVRELLDS